MTTPRSRGRLAARIAPVLLAAVAVSAFPAPVHAQYSFGRNKVQYDRFDFRVIETPHFAFHYYPVEAPAVEDLARMSERWYERFARTFQHEFEAPKPVIVYADHPDFQQTNTLQGFLGEGTGGVTESLKNRVILPLTGSYADNDHVIGHELVHAFQYNIALARRGGGLQGLNTLPLWLVEGMAEYLSVGRDDPLTAKWLRDAIRREDFPSIKQMTSEQRFFPYRFGQALWAYIGGVYGDDAIVQVYRRSLQVGFQPALQQILGVSADTLSAQWKATVAEAYLPLLEGRTDPTEIGTMILGPDRGAGKQNIAPTLSRDGRYVAFLSEKDLFSVDLYLAETASGRIVRKLTSAASDTHSDALRYVESAGTFSPDGERFAYVVFAGGDSEIVIAETKSGHVKDRLTFEGMGAMNNPAWSPDGSMIAFSGMVGGISDLYVVDLDSGELTQLTDDKYADLHPAWSPDGRWIAFASDRGPETDFDALTYSSFRIALLDMRTRGIRPLGLLGNVRHSNPQFGRDANELYFLSDADGFADIYRTDLRSNTVERVTRVATAVSGITAMSPALSVASGTGDIAFSVFNEFGFNINTLPADTPGEPVTRVADADAEPGRRLPPTDPNRFSRVAEYLADAQTGLPAKGMYTQATASDYNPSLALDYVGQPTLGVGTDRFGNYVGGGASALFSDMLGNQIMGVALQANGTFKDIGGQLLYADLSHRWNWAVGAGRIPYLLLFQTFGQDENGLFASQFRQRIFLTSLNGTISYPFNMTRRVEVGMGFSRYSYDVEEDVFRLDNFGRVISFDRRNRSDLEADALNLGQASLAYVGDNSFFGFTSPIRGGRFRFEVEGTLGTKNFYALTADWRRYYAPTKNLTVAVRALHYGRYGLGDLQDGGFNDFTGIVRPLFLGYETLIRGYAFESFDASQGCNQQSCPTLERLFGQRIGVMNFELRVPLLGVEEFGLINFPYLPTELVAFADAGVAYDTWNGVNSPVWKWSRSGAERVPVTSVGVSARVNLLGFLVLETYYAYPFQRPDKGAHWGFSLAPGW